MNPEVMALFRLLADRSPAERDEHYAREQVPAAVRAEVESLLRYDQSEDSFRSFVASAAEKVLLEQTPSAAQATGAGQPHVIGRFEVVRLLGRGGMGDVYLARDPVLEREVAIKLIGAGMDDGDARRRLVREARAAGRLRHPNIVTVFEAGEHEHRSYIAMEYVPGETLGSLIRRRAPIPLRRRLELVESACSGLAHAHRAGVVHLDIKPDNLMLDETGVVKVLDFGISRVLHNETIATAHAGTLRYMSPEQLEGRDLDHRSDVFSVGASLFELVSYMPAYRGSTKDIVLQIGAGPVPSLQDASPEIDPRLDEIVRKAMAIWPADRYDDLEQLRVDLATVRADIDDVRDDTAWMVGGGAASSSGPLTPRTPSARPPSSRPLPSRTAAMNEARAKRSRALGIAAAAMVVVVVLGFAAWRTLAPEPRPVETTTAATSGAAPAAPAPTPMPTPLPPAAVATPASVDPAPATDEVWRRLAAGDREGVVTLLAPMTGSNAGRASARVPSDVIAAVRSTVMRARERAAAVPGVPASDAFKSADAELARAGRLETGGRHIESLRALWQAADLYARPLPPDLSASTLDVRSMAPAPSPSIVADPPLIPPVTRPTSESRVPATDTRAANPDLRSTEARPPAPVAASPAPANSAASPASAAVQPPSDTDAILETLRRYHAAYESLDVASVVKAYPSLAGDQVEQLRRTFAGLSTYEVDLRNPRVDLQRDAAVVHATVARRMTPRVGRPIANEVETDFRLQRSAGAWVIVGVSAR